MLNLQHNQIFLYISLLSFCIVGSSTLFGSDEKHTMQIEKNGCTAIVENGETITLSSKDYNVCINFNVKDIYTCSVLPKQHNDSVDMHGNENKIVDIMFLSHEPSNNSIGMATLHTCPTTEELESSSKSDITYVLSKFIINNEKIDIEQICLPSKEHVIYDQLYAISDGTIGVTGYRGYTDYTKKDLCMEVGLRYTKELLHACGYTKKNLKCDPSDHKLIFNFSDKNDDFNRGSFSFARLRNFPELHTAMVVYALENKDLEVISLKQAIAAIGKTSLDTAIMIHAIVKRHVLPDKEDKELWQNVDQQNKIYDPLFGYLPVERLANLWDTIKFLPHYRQLITDNNKRNWIDLLHHLVALFDKLKKREIARVKTENVDRKIYITPLGRLLAEEDYELFPYYFYKKYDIKARFAQASSSEEYMTVINSMFENVLPLNPTIKSQCSGNFVIAPYKLSIQDQIKNYLIVGKIPIKNKQFKQIEIDIGQRSPIHFLHKSDTEALFLCSPLQDKSTSTNNSSNNDNEQTIEYIKYSNVDDNFILASATLYEKSSRLFFTKDHKPACFYQPSGFLDSLLYLVYPQASIIEIDHTPFHPRAGMIIGKSMNLFFTGSTLKDFGGRFMDICNMILAKFSSFRSRSTSTKPDLANFAKTRVSS